MFPHILATRHSLIIDYPLEKNHRNFGNYQDWPKKATQQTHMKRNGNESYEQECST